LITIFKAVKPKANSKLSMNRPGGKRLKIKNPNSVKKGKALVGAK
jgi:hypothetical protein